MKDKEMNQMLLEKLGAAPTRNPLREVLYKVLEEKPQQQQQRVRPDIEEVQRQQQEQQPQL